MIFAIYNHKSNLYYSDQMSEDNRCKLTALIFL